MSRRSIEMSLALKQTFESVIMTELYPQSKIDITVQVLQSDGGKFGCSILFFCGGGDGVHNWGEPERAPH